MHGKLNFYLSAVDDILKTDEDNPSIGILLCKEKNKVKAEYALKDINKPIGISEYELIKAIPEDLKSNLPTIEEIESEMEEKIEMISNFATAVAKLEKYSVKPIQANDFLLVCFVLLSISVLQKEVYN